MTPTSTDPSPEAGAHTETDRRLLAAALHLVASAGPGGATTKAIAAEAGVNEVTLFRRFSSKAELLAAALTEATIDFRAAATEPTDDVTADLAAVADDYARFVDARPELVSRLLAEAVARTELGETTRAIIGDNATAVRRLVEHHQRAGRLRPDPAPELVTALLGPILTRATIGPLLVDGAPPPFDPRSHVARFLTGAAPPPGDVPDSRP